jgi:biopolymer transport protein ExbD
MNSDRRLTRRLQQHQARARRWPVLNLVPLMDVFTILVFFFLVHSTDVAMTADHSSIELPESVADRKPRETLIVTITRDSILLQGEPVVELDAVPAGTGRGLGVLRTHLVEHRDRQRILPQAEDPAGREIMIMGDKSIPFALLRQVMLTCEDAGFGRISLSVIQRSRKPG